MSERDVYAAPLAADEVGSEWIVRAGRWLVAAWRPDLGWLVLACCAALTVLPALLLWENRWLRVASLQAQLYYVGPQAVLCTWALLGWRRPWRATPRLFRIVIQSVLFVVIGIVLISQLLGGWLPAPGAWWQAATTGTWSALATGIRDSLAQVGERYLLWGQGVQENNAARDDLVLTGIVATAIWLLSGLTVWITRRFKRGLAAGVPILWPVGFVMLYSPADRWIFVAGVGITLVLHMLLSQQMLERRWRAQKLDYNPSLLIERNATALTGFTVAIVLAAMIPNLYITAVTARYYDWLQPVNGRMEAVAKRLFPGLTGVAPWQSRGIAGGLPNAFLLGAGPDAGKREVMRVRTNEPTYTYDSPPLGHTLRGATFVDYDGRGWDNVKPTERELRAAEEPWMDFSVQGRRQLLQSVNLAFLSQVLYAAGEPQAPSVDYVAETRFPGDLVAMAARVRSYTIVSQIPALDAAQLDALPAWGASHPLAPEYAIYLDLPSTITERTRQLAQDLTAAKSTPYAKAAAIEEYLRQYTYDLTVAAPPEGVTDVADYFLFDLRRGYCDYYATAFVVLARLAGLPARFVTGFAPGNWSPVDRLWVITEADAHSWPEVYFPEVGWVPFEPTGGQPVLARIGAFSASGSGESSPTFEPLPPAGEVPLWRLLWWTFLALLPLTAVVWGISAWRTKREDPWIGLLRWGKRAGRPLQDGETTLEYGQLLAVFVEEKYTREPEISRTAARDVQALSEDVSATHYAPQSQRASLRQGAMVRWARVRQYLRRLR